MSDGDHPSPSAPAGGPRFATVVFDCDSTLSAIEGIDVLAGADPRVRELTDAAMAGRLPLDAVYGERLSLTRPDRARIDDLARRYVAALVPDARQVVGALLRAGVHVHVVSGGLRPALLPLAAELGIDAGAVHAVDLRLDDAGDFDGWQEDSPLARAGGKLALLRSLADVLPRPVLLVGDGATDLEARDAVDLFVAYAGVVERPNVTAAADVVIRSASLAPLLPLALAADASERGDRAVRERGARLWREGLVEDRREREAG